MVIERGAKKSKEYKVMNLLLLLHKCLLSFSKSQDRGNFFLFLFNFGLLPLFTRSYLSRGEEIKREFLLFLSDSFS